MIYQVRAKWKCDGCGVRAVAYHDFEGVTEAREPIGWMPGRELGKAYCADCATDDFCDHIHGAAVIERRDGVLVKTTRCRLCNEVLHEELFGD